MLAGGGEIACWVWCAPLCLVARGEGAVLYVDEGAARRDRSVEVVCVVRCPRTVVDALCPGPTRVFRASLHCTNSNPPPLRGVASSTTYLDICDLPYLPASLPV